MDEKQQRGWRRLLPDERSRLKAPRRDLARAAELDETEQRVGETGF
jgi:hypothetical protein